MALGPCLFLHVSGVAALEVDCPKQRLLLGLELYQMGLKAAGPAWLHSNIIKAKTTCRAALQQEPTKFCAQGESARHSEHQNKLAVVSVTVGRAPNDKSTSTVASFFACAA